MKPRMQLTEDMRQIREALSRVDWASAAFRIAAFARIMRGETNLEVELARLRERAERLHNAIRERE